MTVIDSADSILMLYSYTGFAETSLAIFEKPKLSDPLLSLPSEPRVIPPVERAGTSITTSRPPSIVEEIRTSAPLAVATPDVGLEHTNSTSRIDDRRVTEDVSRTLRLKRNMVSGLSMVLTFMSIMVAFRLVYRWVACSLIILLF